MQKYYGLYKAECASNIDPYNMGRIKVRILETQDTTEEKLSWASYCSPLGGSADYEGAGFYMVPDKKDIVWVMFEDGELTRPVYIGNAFRTGTTSSHIPVEAKENMISPKNRVIKTKAGHCLELDDREKDASGTVKTGIRITSGGERGLHLLDGSEEVILFNAAPMGHSLTINHDGIKIVTAKECGVYINDNLNSILVTNNSNNVSLSIMNQSMLLDASQSIIISTKALTLDATSSYTINTDGGYTVSCGDYSNTIGADYSIIAGNDMFLTATNNISITSAGNFLINLPAPGVPTVSGNVDVNTTLGQIMLRVGPRILIPPNPLNGMTSLPIDAPLDAEALGRIGISQTGSVRIEGMRGGIYISPPVPIVLPGMASLIKTGLPIQPAVLGTNLYLFLSLFSKAFSLFVKTNVIAAPAYVTTGVGPGTLNALPAWVAFDTILDTLSSLYLNPAPTPTNILSSNVFLDT